jgi:hypothetical protein
MLGGLFSGKRNRITVVDDALEKCHSAASKSVGLEGLIKVCKDYLIDVLDKNSSRVFGVRALLENAVRELAQWRLRERAPLPAVVYRMDSRLPAEIATKGFQPWKESGNISIIEHVLGSIKGSTKLAKFESQYVSTTANLDFAKDMTFVSKLPNNYFFKITTRAVSERFSDVSKVFDENEVANPFETQFEWIHEGGIPADTVTHFITGRVLIDNALNNTDIVPDALDWQEMPKATPLDPITT